MRLVVIGLVALVVCGCATELTERGAMVRQIQPDWCTTCEFLGVVMASEGSGMDVVEDRMGALNQIRNKVAEMNGNAFVLTDMASGYLNTLVQADAYRCEKQGR